MSADEGREILIQKYINLQKSAQVYISKINDQIGVKDPKLDYLLRSLERITQPHEEKVQTNMAQVALNSKQIELVTSQIMSYVSVLDKPSKLRSLIETKETGAPFIIRESKSVTENGERMTVPEDVNAQSTNYLMTMVETQAMSGELETYADSLRASINESSDRSILQNLKDMGQKLKNFLGMIPGRARDMGEALLERIGEIPARIKGGAKFIRDVVISTLKEISDLLRNFAIALIGAIFDLAAWIQNIATTRNFSIKEFGIEIQPLEVNIVGPVAIPKFQTPKLTVSFGPKT